MRPSGMTGAAGCVDTASATEEEEMSKVTVMGTLECQDGKASERVVDQMVHLLAR